MTGTDDQQHSVDQARNNLRVRNFIDRRCVDDDIIIFLSEILDRILEGGGRQHFRRIRRDLAAGNDRKRKPVDAVNIAGIHLRDQIAHPVFCMNTPEPRNVRFAHIAVHQERLFAEHGERDRDIRCRKALAFGGIGTRHAEHLAAAIVHRRHAVHQVGTKLDIRFADRERTAVCQDLLPVFRDLRAVALSAIRSQTDTVSVTH